MATPGGPRDQPCRSLVAKGCQGFDRGADKYNPFLPTTSGELGIFGKEAITRVNGVDVMLFGEGDNFLDVQIISDRFSGTAHLICLVGLKPVQGISVFVAVNRNRRDAKFAGAAKYTDRNLASVGYQQPSNLFYLSGRSHLDIDYNLKQQHASLSLCGYPMESIQLRSQKSDNSRSGATLK